MQSKVIMCFPHGNHWNLLKNGKLIKFMGFDDKEFVVSFHATNDNDETFLQDFLVILRPLLQIY